MNQIYYMGVDISKEKVDVAVMSKDYQLVLTKVIKNDTKKLVSFINSLLRKLKLERTELLVCCEETGIYKRPLQHACINCEVPLWVEAALKIKRASSSMRGKSDKQDAMRIAEYALRYSDKQNLYKESSAKEVELQTMLNTRESLLEEVTRMNQRMNESKRFDEPVYELQSRYCKNIVRALKKQIVRIEEDIEKLVNSNPEIKRTLELVSQIPGIGKQTALQFIVYTKNFTLFKSAKHLACYAGIAPFPNESGNLIGKHRVSHLANKKLKKLLHLASMASIRSNSEIKNYFIRKVKEGKNKMLVLNNVRNKLVKRMFAVVKRKTEYVSINFETNTCILT